MLNLTLLKDGAELWGAPTPCWELELPRTAERCEIRTARQCRRPSHASIPPPVAEARKRAGNRLHPAWRRLLPKGKRIFGTDDPVESCTGQEKCADHIPAAPPRSCKAALAAVSRHCRRYGTRSLPGIVRWITELQKNGALPETASPSSGRLRRVRRQGTSSSSIHFRTAFSSTRSAG